MERNKFFTLEEVQAENTRLRQVVSNLHTTISLATACSYPTVEENLQQLIYNYEQMQKENNILRNTLQTAAMQLEQIKHVLRGEE